MADNLDVFVAQAKQVKSWLEYAQLGKKLVETAEYKRLNFAEIAASVALLDMARLRAIEAPFVPEDPKKERASGQAMNMVDRRSSRLGIYRWQQKVTTGDIEQTMQILEDVLKPDRRNCRLKNDMSVSEQGAIETYGGDSVSVTSAPTVFEGVSLAENYKMQDLMIKEVYQPKFAPKFIRGSETGVKEGSQALYSSIITYREQTKMAA